VADSGKGTEATLLAPGVTLGATEASLRPRAASTPPVAESGDYGDLVIVDPVHYTDIRELARGGMGRILEARDRRLGRRVAIKEMLHLDEISLVRFEREARITARLQHPAIVHVHEAGRWPSGQPFYAMKLIHGKPLDTCLAAAKTLEERLALLASVIAVVDALAYAHSEHVVHRDLKPANVLVGDFGETVVIDWGLAKDLTSDEADDVAVGPYRKAAETAGGTLEGAIIGTPAFMPPEQAAGERVDARADVYALGALLYQLLVGAPPYEGRSTADVLNKVLDNPPVPIAEREPDAPADLIAIVEKAMARDAADRFPTAKEMVGELKRFQMGQLVTSHRYTTWELATRWIRRHRGAVAVGAIALVTLATFAAVGIWQILGERNRADREAAIVQERADAGTLARAREALETDPTAAIAILQQLSPQSAHWQGARTIAAEAAERGVAHVLRGGDDAIWMLAFSPDGTLLASHDNGHHLRIWDLRTWESRTLLPDVALFSLAFDTEGRIVGVDSNGHVWRWDMPGGTASIVRTISGAYDDASLAPDGHRFVAFDPWTASRLVELAGGERVLGKYSKATWSPDGSALVLAGEGEHIDRFDLATQTMTNVGIADRPMSFATDGKRVWLGYPHAKGSGNDISGRIDELPSNTTQAIARPVARLVNLPNGGLASSTMLSSFASDSLQGQVKGIRLPIDPNKIVSNNSDILLTDSTRMGIGQLRGHLSSVWTLVVARDGRIASGDLDGEIRVWNRAIPVSRTRGDGKTTTSRAMLTADRRELIMTRRGPELEVRDIATGRIRKLSVTEYPAGYVPREVEFSMHTTQVGDHRIGERSENAGYEVTELVASTNGRRLVTVDSEHQVVAWDLDTNRGRVLIPPPDSSQVGGGVHAAINTDGTRVVTKRDNKILELWDVASGKATTIGEDLDASAFAFSSDGSLAVAIVDHGVRVGRPDKTLNVVTNDNTTYRSLAFSPDGRTLVAGGDDARLHVFDLATGTSLTWGGHSATILSVVFSPDGRHVASASADNTVRVWRLADGTSTVLTGHRDLITSIVFEGNDTIVTASNDRTARIWDLRSGLGQQLSGHEDVVVFAGHLAGDHRVVVVDHIRQIATHLDVLPRGETGLRAWIAGATNLTK
jgi:WD40 repeat protein/tRNA A-37 threonylcarbamoyl transferase component Bud32